MKDQKGRALTYQAILPLIETLMLLHKLYCIFLGWGCGVAIQVERGSGRSWRDWSLSPGCQDMLYGIRGPVSLSWLTSGCSSYYYSTLFRYIA
jgi:hypothetical protein